MKFRCNFHGRPIGAIGIRWAHSVVVEAKNADEALARVYEKYEHIHGYDIQPETVSEFDNSGAKDFDEIQLEADDEA